MNNGESVGRIILGITVQTMINFLLAFGLVEGFLNSYHFSYKLFADIPYKAASSEMKNITIEEGTDAKQVAQILSDNELVDGKYLMLARMYIGKYDDKVKAGTYTLSPGMTPDEICRCICKIQSEDST